MITIVDYGLGNLGSIQNMLRKIGVNSMISNREEEIAVAERIILPGIGAFDSGMGQLRESGLTEILNHKALVEQVPVLGICLGAQIMTKRSDEGDQLGLGWFDAETRKFDLDKLPGKWPLPNIGWRDVYGQSNYEILTGFGERQPRFYFVHSYYMSSEDQSIVSMTTEYGHQFACGLHKDNLHCAQFHPEKSHTFGKVFLKNFVETT